MTGCDKCDCFAEELTSLDGFTLLCPDCQQTVLAFRDSFINSSPAIPNEVETVWGWLRDHRMPFRVEESETRVIVVYYGSADLLGIKPLLADWEIMSASEVPEGLLGFGQSRGELDWDSNLISSDTMMVKRSGVLLLVEEYNRAGKVQVVFPK